MKNDDASLAAAAAPVNATLLATALPILQGLLASGHYTYLSEDTFPELRVETNGQGWRERGFTRFQNSYAIQEAINLAEELIDEINRRLSA